MAKGLKTQKQQRLIIILTGLAALSLAVFLILFAIGKDSLSLFLQPSDAMARDLTAGDRIRLGGLVAPGSLELEADELTYRFTVTDCVADVTIRYRGELPALFRDGQGVIAEGHWAAGDSLTAETILAKHDENYAPPGTQPKGDGACVHPNSPPER